MNQGFGKEYKLCSRKIIDALFNEGEGIKSYPFMIRYQITSLPKEIPFQIVITAPKRNFKRAVDRNRIKRLMREVFRKNRHQLEERLQKSNQQLALFIMYTGREMPDYSLIELKLQKALLKLNEALQIEN
ncbi:ribonuclease P protein component [Lishizhenia tianjinensis]|uniref:Ribonuclease P protein component n=1 Tax=Lishizhenia tianjinensis TaxID=477690 RepID=A0A1I7BEP1_9FLAO|nr:ribonuclease P protein component [Lishizhenia tianjinensis]SFT85572.1 ribonuclease P protein component [Lishizhenia tianjinensis]